MPVFLSYNFALLIYGELAAMRKQFLRFDSSKSQIFFKGEKRERPNVVMEQDFFSFQDKSEGIATIENHQIVYKFETPPNEVFDGFLEEIIDHKDILQDLPPKSECSIRVFINAQEAQTDFIFTPSNINKLSVLNLPCEISVLSWGEVIDIN